MKWIAWSTLAAAVAFAPVAFAQGSGGNMKDGTHAAQAKENHIRVKGLVKQVGNGSLEVQSIAPDKREYVFKTSPNTKVQRGEQSLTLQDLKPGERVMVRAQRNQNGELSAQAIRLGQHKAAVSPKQDRQAHPRS